MSSYDFLNSFAFVECVWASSVINTFFFSRAPFVGNQLGRLYQADTNYDLQRIGFMQSFKLCQMILLFFRCFLQSHSFVVVRVFLFGNDFDLLFNLGFLA
jgi:hypothetical protein